MEGKELVEFVGKLKDLEAAIFTNQQVLNQFDERMASLAPKQPEQPKLHDLSEPWKPTTTKVNRVGVVAWFCGAILLFACGIVLLILTAMWGLGGGIGIFTILAFVGGIGVSIIANDENKKVDITEDENERAERDYQRRMSEYRLNHDRHEQENRKMQEQYQIAVKSYDENTQLFVKDRKESLALLKKTEASLEGALQAMYETGVIYPKYQNFVAVSALYEYLSSGRCSALEGANGAYNLYEMELRQNIVIGQLSSIIANLEGIRTNQYTLYQEISSANRKSADLLQNITDTAKINAHYAESAAKSADIIRYASLVSASRH